jgi:hypothetical protein
VLTEFQIEKLNEIAAECHEADPVARGRLSATDYEDWAPTLDAEGLLDLADRVREVFRDL